MSVDERVPVYQPAAAVALPFTRADTVLTCLFTLTAFLGAGLLFVVQPLVAKLVLPSYGGSATVWSTSSLFFQVLLLAAYAYVHWSTARFGRVWQPRVHLAVLVVPLLALPLALPTDAAPGADSSPALWLLRTLALMIGLPFAVVATTGPVLQKWYSWTGSSRAGDPYFLFAASNLGSFGGLLAYPFLIEPHLSLAAQRTWWTVGFYLFAVLTGCCGLTSLRRGRPATPGIGTSSPVRLVSTLAPRRVLRWLALAFLPSSLMLGVTAHLSTDVAAIPLLWVVPLAVYLATFVAAFSRKSRQPPLRLTRAAVATGLVAVVGTLVPGAMPIGLAVTVNLVMLGLVGYAAHARLAADRPSPNHLTHYFLVVASGGALGGLLNGLIAPVVFDRVLEYQLALVAVPLLLVGLASTSQGWLARQWRANYVRAGIVVLGIAIVTLFFRLALWLSSGNLLLVGGITLLVALVGWWVCQQPWALLLAVLFLYGATAVDDSRGVVEQTRTFFGTLTVEENAATHRLVHGTTIHGTQFRDPSLRTVPTTYYSSSGPLGDLFGAADRYHDVAAVGLGAGTVAAYGHPGQEITFFEIDPEVARIANDPRLFSYIEDSPADITTVVGDGRLKVATHPSRSFDLLILDAFSSDSIPVHLLTTEAMQMYADRLTADGVLAVHISNRVFDLEPVLAAAAAELGWRGVVGAGTTSADGATPSTWVVLSPDDSAVEALLAQSNWSELDEGAAVRWTDSYSSILSVLR